MQNWGDTKALSKGGMGLGWALRMVTVALAFKVTAGMGEWMGREKAGSLLRDMVTAVLTSLFSELLGTVVPFRTTQQVQKDLT